MNKNQENIIVWILRILISGLFIVSAYSKMFPAATALDLFAKQIVDIGVTNWCYAPLLARAIVGFELFLGLAILQNNFLKNIIVPATFFLLLAFCIHLTITIFTTGNNGSCGCFGELIPMTPLEAIIKNVILMVMLVYIFIKVTPKEKDRLLPPAIIISVIYIAILLFLPPKCCCASMPSSQEIVSDSVVISNDSMVVNVDSVGTNNSIDEAATINNGAVKKPEQTARKKVNSVFSKYSKFSSGAVDLNSGKKIVCLFSLDCEHCQDANKQLLNLKNKHADFPGVYILALGEEEQVSDFFKAGGGRFPYSIIPAQEFFQLLDKAQYPPRIVVMDNGNFLGDFLDFEQLDTAAVMKAVNR